MEFMKFRVQNPLTELCEIGDGISTYGVSHGGL